MGIPFDLWVAIMLISIFRYDSLKAGISVVGDNRVQNVCREKREIISLGRILMRVGPLVPKGVRRRS